ncbi:PREDICTED: uncharacterized protein LOC106332793 isoform X1 [Brassica oleracea var. oleracea]|uniref:uncharacterized protein LOC106332793 isoform X1 n=2 Tax=Brassica oleracea var. oleracea TaxID=109376 RepID=UPI0006A7136B|nr:PREDICTED: uncharacterized protein LOC106332793 isoform X1 [Brassica oleracea var. oleracea]
MFSIQKESAWCFLRKNLYCKGLSFVFYYMRNVCLIDVQVSWRQGRYYFAMNETDVEEQKKGKYVLIRDGGDEEGNELGGLFYKPLPCFGLGIGWLSFLLGFFFPFAWYFATFLYLTNYYRRDPRERSGLAASAIAALIFTVALLITVLVLVFSGR